MYKALKNYIDNQSSMPHVGEKTTKEKGEERKEKSKIFARGTYESLNNEFKQAPALF